MISKIDPNEICIDANIPRGLRRTNADKRRAVEMLLSDPECERWSDRQIAKHCAVQHQMVGTVRTAYLDESSRYGVGADTRLSESDRCSEASIFQNSPDPVPPPPTRTVTRNGVTYKMHTGNIGRRSASAPPGSPEKTGAAEAEAESPEEMERRIRKNVLDDLADGVFTSDPAHLQWLDALNSRRRDGALSRGLDDYVPNCRACRDNEGGDQPFKRSIALVPSEYTEGRDKADGPDVVFCPFCGENYGFVIKPLEEGHAAVVCHSCGAVGPFGAPAEAAKRRWNTRF